ncbi:uncharacterized protein LOC128988080 [Macrosteles quadrilineatus]|uniref:uncharacterized protein LOC128988080 n=1 Tax=Macrosteles quadrilineatus TaxID=74068 RepID=UPI0023E1AF4B|nr:uncharacterized protein LOC128988080 [Macrosteles quadrilineatus]
MGFIDCVVVLCLALAFVEGKYNWVKAKENWKVCVAETGAVEDMEAVLRKEIVPTSDKGMCLVDCLMRTEKIYDSEGKYNREGTKEYFSELLEEQPEMIEKAMASADECSKIDVEGLDRCEAAVKHLTCARAKFVQYNIKVNKD